MSWQAAVVAHMCESKRAGYGYEDAWQRATTIYPPRGRNAGPVEAVLFDEDGRASESVVEAFKRYTADAWYGRRPGLVHFHPSLLIGTDDEGPERRGASRRAQYTA